MAEFRVSKVDKDHIKIRNVPIAVTPEGFWCCPSPAVFQKTLKAQNLHNKPRTSSSPPKQSIQKKHNTLHEKKSVAASSRPRDVFDEPRNSSSDTNCVSPSVVTGKASKPTNDNPRQKVAIEFGESGTSDIKVVLCGKQGFCVKMSVHKNVLVENSKYFSDQLSHQQSPSSYLEISDCEDVEIYVETVGLMYCKEMKQRLIKQSVSRVLRVLKGLGEIASCYLGYMETKKQHDFQIAEFIGFQRCIEACLEYLEAVPWVGEEEEEKVVSSVLHLRNNNVGVVPVLKRVSSDVSNPPSDTLTHIMKLVLKSNEERGRREMKSLVLRLLRDNSNLLSNGGSAELLNENIYSFCQRCLSSLLDLFRQASEPGFVEKTMDSKGPVVKQIAVEADNLLWLLDILADRQAADEFAQMWASQQELATLHSKLPTVSRHLISCITARFFVGIGRGEILPSKDTRLLLLQTWLQPLIDDYCWLQHSCRFFDRKVVEEGIGRTILTLPLEDQQNILLSWLGSFLKAGDNCPNLHRAFEVWWRRTFVRPHVEQQESPLQSV